MNTPRTTAPQSMAQKLQLQQASIKVEAAEALAAFNDRLLALMAEARELSKLEGVYSKPVQASLDRFISFAGGTLDVVVPQAASPAPVALAQAA